MALEEAEVEVVAVDEDHLVAAAGAEVASAGTNPLYCNPAMTPLLRWMLTFIHLSFKSSEVVAVEMGAEEADAVEEAVVTEVVVEVALAEEEDAGKGEEAPEAAVAAVA